MDKRIIGLLTAVMAVALIVAGCGSGDDSTDESTASLTKAEFLKQGNAICAAGNKEINTEFEKFFKENEFSKKKQPTQAQLEEAAEEIAIPSIRKQIDGVRALGAPSGEEEQVNEIVDTAEEALEEGEEDPAALVSEENGNLFAKANKLANAYGLTACGEGEEEGK